MFGNGESTVQQLRSHLLSKRPVGVRRESPVFADQEAIHFLEIGVRHLPGPPPRHAPGRPRTRAATWGSGRVRVPFSGEVSTWGLSRGTQPPFYPPPVSGAEPTTSHYFFSSFPSPYLPHFPTLSLTPQALSEPASPASRAETPNAPLPRSCVDWKAFTGPWSGVSQPLNGGKIR